MFFLKDVAGICKLWEKNKVVGALLHPSIKYMYVYVCKVVGASVSSHLSSLVFNRSSVSSKHRGAIIHIVAMTWYPPHNGYYTLTIIQSYHTVMIYSVAITE